MSKKPRKPGRPRGATLEGEPLTVRRQILLPEGLHRQIIRAAGGSRHVGAWIRQIIKAAL